MHLASLTVKCAKELDRKSAVLARTGEHEQHGDSAERVTASDVVGGVGGTPYAVHGALSSELPLSLSARRIAEAGFVSTCINVYLRVSTFEGERRAQ